MAVGWQPFDEGARRLLVAFSSQVAVALANARRVASEREQLQETARREAAAAAEGAAAEGLRRAVEAQEAERARVARELHDESGQVLTALALHLRALEDDVGPGDVRERIAEMRRSLGVRVVEPARARHPPAAGGRGGAGSRGCGRGPGGPAPPGGDPRGR